MGATSPASDAPVSSASSSGNRRANSEQDHIRAERFLADHRLIVCVGPGGVGKTSVAATLALEAARRGRRALVLTIDPARRLATALGLDGLDDGVRAVPTDELLRYGARIDGRLDAAMLETRASYDSLIERLNGVGESTRRILENRVYQAFSRTLARSHAYVAMERLYDVMQSEQYDLVVLDTPPTRSALDILDAPGRLVRFLDDEAVRWFLKPRFASGALSRLIPTGGAAATRILGMLASRQLVEELVGFFSVLWHLREGFKERAEAVQRILRADSTAFCLVCSPSRTSLWDAAYLRDGLVDRGVPPGAVIFNRAYVPRASDPAQKVGWAPPQDPAQRLGAIGLEGRRVSEAMLVLLHELAKLRQDTAAWNHVSQASTDRFAERLPQDCLSVRLPELSEDPRDLIDLLQLSRALFDWEGRT